MSKNLISITGRIGSGKDTVAYIIQRLVAFNLKYNPEYFFDDEFRKLSEWKIKKFAGSLKEIAGILTGIPVGNFEDQEFKKTKLGLEWGNMTVREFLQRLGTDAIRDNLYHNTWVNALFAGIDEKSKIIITDTRFPNELIEVKSRGGVSIKVLRGDSTVNINEHISESALDSADFDHIIYNNGSLEDLEKAIKEILIIEGII